MPRAFSASHRRALAALLGLAVVAGLWWFAVVRPSGRESAGDEWTVVHVVDGDTIDVERDGVRATVRMIGIDTPEIGECGYNEARAWLDDAVGNGQVTLVDGATTDADKYGRLLRYVEVDGEDQGLRLISLGLAVARYDSRSGKPHPRELDYRATQETAEPWCSEEVVAP